MTKQPSTIAPDKESEMAQAFYAMTWTIDPIPAAALSDGYPRKWAALRTKLDHMLTPDWSENGRPWLMVNLPDKRQVNLARVAAGAWAKSREVSLRAHKLEGVRKQGQRKPPGWNLWLRVEDERDDPAKLYAQK